MPSSEDDPTTVRITLRDVYGEVQDLKMGVAGVSARVDTFLATWEERDRVTGTGMSEAKTQAESFDMRLDTLERWKAAVPLSALAALASAMAAIVAAVAGAAGGA